MADTHGVDPRWHTSSYSGSNGACVEVAIVPSGVHVRDSKDRGGPVLRFSAAAWRAFVAAVVAGELSEPGS